MLFILTVITRITVTPVRSWSGTETESRQLLKEENVVGGGGGGDSGCEYEDVTLWQDSFDICFYGFCADYN